MLLTSSLLGCECSSSKFYIKKPCEHSSICLFIISLWTLPNTFVSWNANFQAVPHLFSLVAYCSFTRTELQLISGSVNLRTEYSKAQIFVILISLIQFLNRKNKGDEITALAPRKANIINVVNRKCPHAWNLYIGVFFSLETMNTPEKQ